MVGGTIHFQPRDRPTALELGLITHACFISLKLLFKSLLEKTKVYACIHTYA